jgi:hypothetical protein
MTTPAPGVTTAYKPCLAALQHTCAHSAHRLCGTKPVLESKPLLFFVRHAVHVDVIEAWDFECVIGDFADKVARFWCDRPSSPKR